MMTTHRRCIAKIGRKLLKRINLAGIRRCNAVNIEERYNVSFDASNSDCLLYQVPPNSNSIIWRGRNDYYIASLGCACGEEVV